MKHVDPAKIKRIAMKVIRQYGRLPYPESRYKQCRVCRDWLSRELYFNKNKHNSDGLDSRCVDCKRKSRKKR